MTRYINRQFVQSGVYTINLNPMDWPSGAYFVQMKSEYGESVKLITRIK